MKIPDGKCRIAIRITDEGTFIRFLSFPDALRGDTSRTVTIASVGKVQIVSSLHPDSNERFVYCPGASRHLDDRWVKWATPGLAPVDLEGVINLAYARKAIEGD